MAPTIRKQLRGARGMTPSELLEASARRWGTATMMADDDGKGGKDDAAGKAKDDDKAKDDTAGKDDEPTAEELAALGDAGKRALERVKADRERLRAEAAAAAEKARKYDELEEANKTEQQRRDEAAAAAAKTAEEATLKLSKLEAALEAGLPHTAAARLVGTTKAELLKDAKAYAEELAAAAPGTRQRRTTSDADKGGDGPTGGMSSLIRRAAGRQA